MSGAMKVEVRRSGRRFEAEAVLVSAADARTVWDTITDYAALPRFMPGIRACRVIARQPLANGAEHLVVEQRGEFRFLLFSQDMMVMLDIEHQPLRMAQAKATSFDLGVFKRRAIDVFEGRYELEVLAAGGQEARIQLRYTSLIGLRLPPPPAIGHRPSAIGHRQRRGPAEPGRSARRGGRRDRPSRRPRRGRHGPALTCRLPATLHNRLRPDDV